VLTLRRFTCLVMAVVATGCGAGRSAGSLTARQTSAPPRESLSSFIEKTREIQTQASAVPTQVLATTLETMDPKLGAALAEARLNPSSAAARNVAAAYARHGIFDMAHQHLMAAVKSDPRDAANYEALARLWRDVRMSHLGIADAHRAVYYAPDWAVAHNTLGTVLQALGQRTAARAEYERAIALDPSAAYALNNLCYSDILDGRFTRAIERCKDALEADATLRAAQNNLGVAYAGAGRMNAALDAFNLGVDPAGALYNLGVVRMARKEYRSAVEAFQAAQARQPSFALAAARAQQASAQLLNGDE
jgi:tetratricopeptide (TPR) repeat protein